MCPQLRSKTALGNCGAKRHRKALRDKIQSITKLAIRRLARRGGVKRISGRIDEETSGILKLFREHFIHDAVTYTESARQTAMLDAVLAPRVDAVRLRQLCACRARGSVAAG